MTALDEPRLEHQAYEYGHADGFEAGYAAAEADMAAHWSRLARSIRQAADRVTSRVPEPAVRPQPDDAMWFTAAEWAALTAEAR